MAQGIPSRLYTKDHVPSLSSFATLCSQKTSPKTYPLAATIQKNIPIYSLPSTLPSASSIAALQDEWYHILTSGPGVYVVRNLFPDPALIDKVNAVFARILATEKASNSVKGDHFAAGGLNSRLWNSLQKHAQADSSSFTQYYSNPWLRYISEAHLGPGYCLTAQLNIVHPGGAPQTSHRDYHLGFQSAERCAAFPKALQMASALLTLQGAVAHSDMPVESGPTRLLPFSQQLADGYVAYRRADFDTYFLENYVSLPLKKGDGLFFSPALFHAAGRNKTSDVSRSANLLQISAAMGKPMESVDNVQIAESCWEDMRRLFRQEGTSERVLALVLAVGEGYPFPTNLDKRTPRSDGMAPESESEALIRGLEEGLGTEEIVALLKQMRGDSRA